MLFHDWKEARMATATSARRGPKPNPHTRADLLKAGVRAFHRGGFNATGVQEIVAEAGVPKGSFYNHFPSKDAFGAEVIDAYFDAAQADLRALLLDPSIPGLDRLERYFSAHTERMTSGGFARGCLLGNLSLEVADHSELMRERLSQKFTAWEGLFAGCIRAAQQDGAIANEADASALAHVLLNSWEGALLRARAEKSREPLDRFRDILFGTLLPAAQGRS